MSSRTDKYKHNDSLPTRSNKNKELYKQVYNAYDEFENLIVPSNTREINPKDLNKEITSRQDYHRKRDYDEIVNRDRVIIDNKKIEEETLEKVEVYDINELLNKAVGDKKEPEKMEDILSNNDYLKKLKLDNSKTNIEQVKELYEDIQEEEEEELMKTANLSLEILSDLKGNNDNTMVDAAPIKEEELPSKENKVNTDFYSSTYKFSKKDFDGEVDDFDDEDDEEENEESGNGKFFLKILLLIFGILFVILVLIYFINYFNRV